MGRYEEYSDWLSQQWGGQLSQALDDAGAVSLELETKGVHRGLVFTIRWAFEYAYKYTTIHIVHRGLHLTRWVEVPGRSSFESLERLRDEIILIEVLWKWLREKPKGCINKTPQTSTGHLGDTCR